MILAPGQCLSSAIIHKLAPSPVWSILVFLVFSVPNKVWDGPSSLEISTHIDLETNKEDQERNIAAYCIHIAVL